MTEYLTSTEAAAIAGVGVSSIKRWADDNRIATVKTPGGHRRIARAELLEFLERSRKDGDGEPGRPMATRWADAILSMDRHRLQARLYEARGRLGSWARVMDELGGGLSEIGSRWADGTTTVGEEHVGSDKLDRALASIHDGIPCSPTAPVCLLATADGDLHALGLSMVRVALREAGWDSLWIGTMTPTSDLCDMIRQSGCAMVGLSASAGSADPDALLLQAQRAAAACYESGARLVLGGRGSWPVEAEAGRRFTDVRSFSQFAAEVA